LLKKGKHSHLKTLAFSSLLLFSHIVNMFKSALVAVSSGAFVAGDVAVDSRDSLLQSHAQVHSQAFDLSDELEGLSLLQLATQKNAANKQNRSESSPSAWNSGYQCAMGGDVHTFSTFSGARGDIHQTGLYTWAQSNDGRFNTQVYQCPCQGSKTVGWINAIALDVDGTRIVVLPPTIAAAEEYRRGVGSGPGSFNILPFHIRANDIEYSTADAPFTIPGTTIDIQMHTWQNMQITTEGLTFRMIQHNYAGKDWQGHQSWIDPAITFASGGKHPDNSFCSSTTGATPVADSSLDSDWSKTLFTEADHKQICEWCELHNEDFVPGFTANQKKCAQPPPQPPPPPAKQECEQSECSWTHAQELCKSLEGDQTLYEDCLFDFCIHCDDFMADALVEDIEDLNPEPMCVQGAAECNPQQVCDQSVTMNTLTVSQNNLGGVGPDTGAEEIRYSNAAVVNGKAVDLVITTDGKFQSSKPSKNGKSGPFGILNVKCGSSVTLTMSVVDSESGAPVILDAVALTWYDLDEGKKGKGRATVSTCGSTGVIVSQNTELVLKREGVCSTATSSVAGTGKDNPKSTQLLNSLQISRSLTVPFKGVSEWTSTLSLARGSKGRNFMFGLEPTVACGSA